MNERGVTTENALYPTTVYIEGLVRVCTMHYGVPVTGDIYVYVILVLWRAGSPGSAISCIGFKSFFSVFRENFVRHRFACHEKRLRKFSFLRKGRQFLQKKNGVFVSTLASHLYRRHKAVPLPWCIYKMFNIIVPLVGILLCHFYLLIQP
jgi:hypothetical protein